MTADFLVEIGTEELPPKSLSELSQSFMLGVTEGLAEKGITKGAIQPFATPRRLALLITDLADKAKDSETEVWGPPLKICFDKEGNPTKAALAFVENNKQFGATIESLKSSARSDGKTEKLYLKATVEGIHAEDCIADIVNNALARLPIPKRMRWGSGKEEFVRPVHWVLMLYGDKTLTTNQVLGLTPGNVTRGHRFHAPGKIPVQSPSDYESTLAQAYVLASFEKRRDIILQSVIAKAVEINGTAIIDDALLDEVTALNEWPVALTGHFDESFLSVPPEALISSMKSHQKYFHVVDGEGQLLPYFITVANIESTDPAQVIAGNEKVIRPRLADAAFFYQTDKKVSQPERRERLKTIVFQDRLGSIFDKTERLAALAEFVAPMVGADAGLAKRAGELSKSDLVSEMVSEFDELQGIMGRYYSANDGESPAVANAMFEHYLPRFATDTLPETPEGIALALADRLDTLVGIFGIEQLPTGSKDPFALRRASLGVIRIAIEKQLDIKLLPLLEKAQSLYDPATVSADAKKQVLTYILERFIAYYPNVKVEIIQAVLAKSLDSPLDIHQRILAVQDFLTLPEASALATAFKRVQNLLSKSDITRLPSLDTSLLVESAEKSLVEALVSEEQTVVPLIASREYQKALSQLAHLQAPLDLFFEQVMVMCDEVDLRENRLAILQKLYVLFIGIADISKLAGLTNG